MNGTLTRNSPTCQQMVEDVKTKLRKSQLEPSACWVTSSGSSINTEFFIFLQEREEKPIAVVWLGARVVTQEQRENLVRPFLEEEVRARIKGLNGEGSR